MENLELQAESIAKFLGCTVLQVSEMTLADVLKAYRLLGEQQELLRKYGMAIPAISIPC